MMSLALTDQLVISHVQVAPGSLQSAKLHRRYVNLPRQTIPGTLIGSSESSNLRPLMLASCPASNAV